MNILTMLNYGAESIISKGYIIYNSPMLANSNGARRGIVGHRKNIRETGFTEFSKLTNRYLFPRHVLQDTDKLDL
jgi:hypothetical protein